MFRIMLVYGALAGLLVIGFITLAFQLAGGKIESSSHLTGYLFMLVGFSLIFVGIKRYRDNVLGGVIKFWPAFRLGLGIALVGAVFYVLGWELYLLVTDFDFAGQYTAMMEEQYRSKGLSATELQTKLDEMAGFMDLYKTWWFRLPITLLEPLPVGVLVALISAAVLRNPKVLPART